MPNLALSDDHRLLDGRQAVEFLMRTKALVEEPEKLLLKLNCPLRAGNVQLAPG
jgi:2-oxoglutarate dehydrogenase E2 component (dihydrolipoamide succinyltransferase)